MRPPPPCLLNRVSQAHGPTRATTSWRLRRPAPPHAAVAPGKASGLTGGLTGSRHSDRHRQQGGAAMAKRSNGEGAVYLRSDGRWEGQLRLPGGRRKSVYAHTRRELVQKLADARGALVQGLPVSSRHQTLSEFLDVWLRLSSHRLRVSTYQSYELNVGRIRRELGRVPLVHLSPPAIQAAYERLSKQGLSPHSVLQVHRALHRALDRAFHWGQIQWNPAALALPPRPQRRQMTALSSDQLALLLDDTEGQALHALWVVLGTAGLRVGEALGLEWASVDLDSGRLSVRQALQRQRGRGLVLVPTKTTRSRRTVQLTRLATDSLREHLEAQSGGIAGEGSPNPGFVFRGRSGGPLDPAGVGRGLKQALRRGGLPRIG